MEIILDWTTKSYTYNNTISSKRRKHAIVCEHIGLDRTEVTEGQHSPV